MFGRFHETTEILVTTPPPRCLVTFLPVFSSLWLLHSIRVNAQIGAGHNGEMFHRFGGVGHAGGGCFHTFKLKSASNNRTLREIWEGKAPGVGWWMTEKWDRYLKYLKKGQAPNWRNLQRFPTPLRPPSFPKKFTTTCTWQVRQDHWWQCR